MFLYSKSVRYPTRQLLWKIATSLRQCHYKRFLVFCQGILENFLNFLTAVNHTSSASWVQGLTAVFFVMIYLFLLQNL